MIDNRGGNNSLTRLSPVLLRCRRRRRIRRIRRRRCIDDGGRDRHDVGNFGSV